MSKNTRILFIVSLFTSVSITVVSPVMAQQNKVYRGSVNQTDVRNKTGPSLNRNDLRDSGGDPFGNDGVPDQVQPDSFEPPPDAFQPEKRRTPPPPPSNRNFGGGVQENLEDLLDGLQPEQALPQNPPFNARVNQQQPTQNLKQDSAELDIAWNQWHERVAKNVYVRFNNMALIAFPHSRPLSCKITYTVTRDGRIINARILESSQDAVFDKMVIGVVSSLNGNPILQFPQGSRRQQVEKLCGFEHNFGQGLGFKYQLDKERVKGVETNQMPQNQMMNNGGMQQNRFNQNPNGALDLLIGVPRQR